MTSLQEIRQKYPQYSDLSDGDLLMGLHRKHYADMHPRQFLSSIEGADVASATIRNPDLKAWYRERVQLPLGDESPDQMQARLVGSAGGATDGGRAMSGLRSAFQGMTFGYGDEIVGSAAAALSGNNPEFERARERQRVQQGESAYPVQSALAEIGGAVAAPGAAVRSVPAAIAAGTAGGTLYASGKAAPGERTEEAVAAIGPSALFSAAAIPAQRFAQKGIRRLMMGAEKKPSLAALKAARDLAYRQVDNAGFSFSPQQYDDTLTAIYAQLDAPTSGYIKGADPKVEKAVRIIEKNWGDAKTLGQVDDLRKALWDVWKGAPKDEARNILGMINQIDDMVETTLGGNPVLRDAREAHKAFARTEYLDQLFRKAENRTSVTGSGGNIYNNYAKVFERIVDDPKLAKKFTDEQLAFFRQAMDVPLSERNMRLLGKLSPEGNGLMMALNVIGGSVDPSIFAVGGAGAVAKRAADARMANRVDQAIGLTAGMQPRPLPTTPTQIPYAASVGGSLLGD